MSRLTAMLTRNGNCWWQSKRHCWHTLLPKSTYPSRQRIFQIRSCRFQLRKNSRFGTTSREVAVRTSNKGKPSRGGGSKNIKKKSIGKNSVAAGAVAATATPAATGTKNASGTRVAWIGGRSALAVLLGMGFLAMGEEHRPISIDRTTGPSMMPTIQPGEWYLRLSTLRWSNVSSSSSSSPSSSSSLWKVGDVVVFRAADPQQETLSTTDNEDETSETRKLAKQNHYCKRIIGLPHDQLPARGEHAELYRNWIHPQADPVTGWINGQEEDDNDGEDSPPKMVIVPDGHVWVEGDNPILSIDSRHYGPIPMESIHGRVLLRLWPFWSRPLQTTRTTPAPGPNSVADVEMANAWFVSSRKRPPPPISSDEFREMVAQKQKQQKDGTQQ